MCVYIYIIYVYIHIHPHIYLLASRSKRWDAGPDQRPPGGWCRYPQHPMATPETEPPMRMGFAVVHMR